MRRARKPVRPERCFERSSIPSWCSRTSVTAAAIAYRPFRSAWSKSASSTAKRTNARYATIASKGGSIRLAQKSCPTDSIQFGELSNLHARAAERVRALHEAGATDAYLYGAPGTPGATGNLGHLHAFFLLTARPEVYNLPAAPSRGADRVLASLVTGLAAAIVLTAAVFGLPAAAS